MSKIWLSCGHGGGDTGAVATFAGRTYYEHTVALGVLDRAKAILEAQKAEVGFVPDGMTLSARIQWVNKNVRNDSLLIECHMNSGGDAAGAEMYFYGGNGESQALAEKFLKVYVKSTGQTSRGVKPDTVTRHKRLGIIRDTTPKAILLEMGFITNQKDLEIVQSKGALGVANMALAWYNKPFLDSYGSEKPPQKVSSWAVASVEKAKSFIGVTGEPVWSGWDRPQDEVQAYTLAHVFHKLGVRSHGEGILTNEEAVVCMDRLGLFTKK